MRGVEFIAFIIFLMRSASGWSFGSWILPKVDSYNPYCFVKECCNKDWINFDREMLSKNLKGRVYGQPLVNNVVNALAAHFSPHYEPRKALTISFHGWTGGGKNYVANFIAESIFRKGAKSKYVHQFIGRLHFSEEAKVEHYKHNLVQWIKGNVTYCPQQLFIFDEVDKMIPDVLNAIKPMIDHRDNIEGIDYRQCIFIFLSNTGAQLINEHYLDMYKEGRNREELALGDFDDYIKRGAFNEKGGFFQNDNIKSDLIDHYIPFLPLEERHIRLCIKDEFVLRRVLNPSAQHIDAVLKIVQWGPEGTKLFSKTGCKRIGAQVGLLTEQYYRKNEL
ncbi:torsin-1A [Cylas formicarius]|uniref:torsin-1A n=1 Tax=Cylas formicarius TaxID=197179 RepID=UPI0029589646|nr:torsin-1A [Cylas formicarius]